VRRGRRSGLDSRGVSGICVHRARELVESCCDSEKAPVNVQSSTTAAGPSIVGTGVSETTGFWFALSKAKAIVDKCLRLKA